MKILTRHLCVAIALAFGLAACDDGGSGPADDAGFDAGFDAGDTDGGTGDALIEILVDNMGIPHIFADTDEDAFYGAGYMLAKERLYQAAMLRRPRARRHVNRESPPGRPEPFLLSRSRRPR